MTENDLADSAVAVMCWDSGGENLVGLMIVRRADGHSCFVDIPPDLEKRLAKLDRTYVEDHAAELLAIAYEGLSTGEFEEDRVISKKFLQQGHQSAMAGTMRHIPAELIANNPFGIADWQSAGFIVDVGELDLTRYRHGRFVH